MTKYNLINYNKGNCMIAEEEGQCFIPIPKNASTSFRKYFEWSFHGSVKNFIKDPEILLDNHVFAIIRDPVDRFCSGYIEIVDRGKENPSLSSYKFSKITDKKEKFIQFVDDVQQCYFDSHIVPQSFFLSDEKGCTIKLDELLTIRQTTKKIESLFYKTPKKKRSVDIVTKKPRVHQNRTRVRRKSLIKSYVEQNKKIQNAIQSLYQKDFILYQKAKQEDK